MSEPIPLKLIGKTIRDISPAPRYFTYVFSMQNYYHGTNPVAAGKIAKQGFQLGKNSHGRWLGRGLYLAANRFFAARYGPVVFRCKLAAGTRILRRTQPDGKTIDSLKREFGAGITTEQFWTALPRNKQFTRKEVISIWHLLWDRMVKTRRRKKLNLSRVFEQLRFHGFDGVADCDPDSPETLIFNPSVVQPLEAMLVKRWSYDLKDSGGFEFEGPIEAGQFHRIGSELEQDKKIQEANDAALDQLYDKLREASLSYLRTHREKHDLPQTDETVKNALVAYWIRYLAKDPNFSFFFSDPPDLDDLANWLVKLYGLGYDDEA